MSALGAAMEAGDVEGVKTLLLALAEPERRKLAKEAAAAQKRFDAGSSVETVKGTWKWRYEGNELQREAATFAVLGTCSASELREISRRRGVHRKAAEFWRELKPSFLSQAAELVTEGGSCWGLARALVREGLSARPTSDGYIRAFIGSGEHAGARRKASSLVEAILQDPALLEYEIWRLFEVEGGGQDSFAAHDKYSGGSTPWASAFLDLVVDGHLPRARVLDATLSALERDFSQFRAGWFSQFHETLAPSVDERRERIDVYLRLLASPIAPTVSFAMSAIKRVEAAAPLSGEQVLPYATRLLAAGKKGAALGLLALLAKIARREPSAAPALARALAVALGHESSDVQKDALDQLDRLRPSLDADAVAHVAAQAGSVAASLRGRLDAWRTGAGEEVVTRSSAEATTERATEDPLSAMDPPIDSLDELIDLAARTLEDPGEPLLLEHVLDAISRLCAERPTDFALRTAPLARRAKAILKRGGETVAGALAKVVIAWVEGRVVEAPNLVAAPTLEAFLFARLFELSMRVSRGEPRPLLCRPTHRAGFVDAAALRERMGALPETGAIDPFDAIAALLRLREEDLATLSADASLRRLDPFRRPVPDPEPSFAVASRTLLVNAHSFEVLIVVEPEGEAAAPPLDDPPAILATVRWYGASAGREKLAIRWASTLMPGRLRAVLRRRRAPPGEQPRWVGGRLGNRRVSRAAPRSAHRHGADGDLAPRAGPVRQGAR